MREDLSKVDFKQFKKPNAEPRQSERGWVPERLIELGPIGKVVGDIPVHLDPQTWEAIKSAARGHGVEIGLDCCLSKAEARRFAFALEESLDDLKAVIRLCYEGRGLTQTVVSPQVTKRVAPAKSAPFFKSLNRNRNK